ncbi:MAG TPA: histidine kinase [Chitinophagaceae bacterium]|nr:histidine kinase [Chitinophagaceae bacterium]
MNIPIRSVLLHCLICFSFLSLPIFLSPEFSWDFHFFSITIFRIDFSIHVLMLVFLYINYYLLIPSLYFKKKYVSYALLLILIFTVIQLTPQVVFGPHHRPHDHPAIQEFQAHLRPSHHEFHAHHNHPHGPRHPFLINLKGSIFIYLFIIVISLFIQVWHQLKQTEKSKRDAELAYLRSQVNPHFIFNTLNSIYSMAIRKSDNTANAILQLSGLMRYSLLDAKSDLVYLRDEFTYINDYIALQRSRLGNSIELEFSEEGDCADLQIAPLLIIPFIENAFKHGVNAEENSSIHIRLQIQQQVLKVEVKNNKVQLHDHIEKSGLGIENTQKRLELIYPTKHQLDIIDLPDTFSVHLTIHLS